MTFGFQECPLCHPIIDSRLPGPGPGGTGQLRSLNPGVEGCGSGASFFYFRLASARRNRDTAGTAPAQSNTDRAEGIYLTHLAVSARQPLDPANSVIISTQMKVKQTRERREDTDTAVLGKK